MELWIRSQNKLDLVPIHDTISILEDEWVEGYERQYQKYNLTCNEKILGIYNSLERALEVLDEIQNHLLKMGHDEIITGKDGFMDGIKHYGIVYEMPEE